MKRPFLVAAVGLVMTTSGALAQQKERAPQAQPEKSSQGGKDSCATLINELRDMALSERPVSMRQARENRNKGNVSACRNSLRLVRQAASEQQEAGSGQAKGGGEIVVRRPEPKVIFRPGQPEVLIQQQRPTVTIEVPPPRVTVRMPRPDVTVRSPDADDQEPSVQMKQRSVQPKVTFEEAEPRVLVRRTDDQPQVRYETTAPSEQSRVEPTEKAVGTGPKQRTGQRSGEDDEAQKSAQRPKQPDRTREAAGRKAGTAVTVQTLLEMSLYDADGDLIGDVERVVRSATGDISLIIGSGGFLGMGEKQIRIQADRVSRSGDRLISQEMSAQEFESMPEWTERSGTTDLGESQRVTVGSGT